MYTQKRSIAPSIRALILLFPIILISCEKEEMGNGTDEGTPSTGDFAEFYLKDAPFEELRVDIYFMEGFAPKVEAVDSLRSFLDRLLHKSRGISVRTLEIPAKGEGDYSIERIDELLEEERETSPDQKRIHADLLIVDGSFAGNDGGAEALGVAYDAQSMALFGETVHKYSNEPTEPPRWKLEGTVLNHELGHLLGLVDNGTPMVNDHRDGGNGHHCDNSDCLMYYAVETSDVVSILAGSSIPRLDAQCRTDLKANGGK